MEDKDIKKHEQRGYSRGYQAGMRRRDHEIAALQRQLDLDVTFKRERVYLSILNGLLSTSTGWKTGEKPVSTPEQYAKLASNLTDAAMRYI